ncbi:hypothetical protein PIB30_004484 [Stylosanthes scabra]|uniref:RNase H type-1 domain-containing protein n=1 Tax=Stylosanthes scabra TaxID=79078 RepID=A0ABU6W3C4_9FABA|nr:hypothetical protein [Stylosanthes scabra]
MNLFFAAIWWIWRERNNDVFNSDSPWNLEKVLGLIRHAASEFKKVSSPSSLSLTPPPIIYDWIPLPSSVFKESFPLLVCSIVSFLQLGEDSFWLGSVGVRKLYAKRIALMLISMDIVIKDLLAKIHDVVHWDWSVLVLPIQRTANKAVDLLARKAASLRLRQNYYWLKVCSVEHHHCGVIGGECRTVTTVDEKSWGGVVLGEVDRCGNP